MSKNINRKSKAQYHQRKKSQTKDFSRFKLYLEYEGTRYSGWQKQPNARTIQGELIKACEKIFGDDFIDLQGSGRTDSGVHALCQVGHLDAKTVLAPEIIKLKFNDLLPHDINILEVEKAGKYFHARHDVKSRSYIYQISKRRTAFGKNFVWWIKDDLDFKAMNAASGLFVGMHDFASFSDDDPEEKSTKVFIESIQLKEEDELILIRIIGSHFIWKMVRRIVGVLVEIGRGKKSESDILFYLKNKSDEPAKFTAPPSGLFLEKVYYEQDKIEKEFRSLIRIDKFFRT
ncbi:MAG: tRNA pseudouridine(38-40) synthase TruA [Ignavibacterium album]|uniref:tRNA pseudouridine(38-40) synthase TruA n=1 Tax=Ignavibacterium album TaxID=591197 RepID=UPI0026F05AC5|nr:tRNA pseudouridine(38-40) synthase TruA [Ignavibacterium album]MBI5662793.1 tRNA pseudouridine(38-40) synthase TruA [Ignavibacterium album]